METRETAIKFIKQLSTTQKANLRIMLQHGVLVGSGYAKENNINPYIFSNELKIILEEKA